MNWPRFGCVSAGVCCVIAGCGEAPDPPGTVTRSGAGSASAAGSNDQVRILEEFPSPDPPPLDGPVTTLMDAGGPPPVQSSPSDAAEPRSTARSFSACTSSGVSTCDYIYVAMAEESTELCVRLTLDNCSLYSRPGLPVDTPLFWRLASGSVATSTEPCLPTGAFDANSALVIGASGSISWNDDGRQPSELVIDITIEASRAVVGLDAGSISLASRDLVGALPECEE